MALWQQDIVGGATEAKIVTWLMITSGTASCCAGGRCAWRSPSR